MRSESQPEARRSSAAVLSATPSITPRLATEALSVPVTNRGRTGTIISVETSVKSEVRPSATMLRLMPAGARDAAERGPEAGAAASTAAEPSTAAGAPAGRRPAADGRDRWRAARSATSGRRLIHEPARKREPGGSASAFTQPSTGSAQRLQVSDLRRLARMHGVPEIPVLLKPEPEIRAH